MKRLTKIFKNEMDQDNTVENMCLDEYLSHMLASVEDGLMLSGFKPGIDYTRKDLLAVALPLVQDAWHDGKISFTSVCLDKKIPSSSPRTNGDETQFSEFLNLINTLWEQVLITDDEALIRFAIRTISNIESILKQ